MNRMWQLESKIFDKKPLSDEEISITRICILRAHSIFIDSKKAKTDLQSHELFIDDDKFYECNNHLNRFPK